MNTKIKIETSAVKGDWCNAKLHDGKEVSIYLKSCPKLASVLSSGEIPLNELDCNLVEKDGKWYAWDPKEEKPSGGGGYKKETPEEKAQRLELEAHKQRMIVAQSSLSASVQFYQERSGVDPLQVQATAKEFYKWVMETSK